MEGHVAQNSLFITQTIKITVSHVGLTLALRTTWSVRYVNYDNIYTHRFLFSSFIAYVSCTLATIFRLFYVAFPIARSRVFVLVLP